MARVLVIEDDRSMNEILVSTLEDVEHDVSSAFNGREALEMCRVGRFDLVITDVRLPGADGVETLGQIKRLQPTVKCIVITGYASQDTPVRAIRLNVEDYLFKPFSLKFFLQSVTRVLEEEEESVQNRVRFEQLLSRHGVFMRKVRDSRLEEVVKEREESFRGLYVGTRSGYLDQEQAAAIYGCLESLEAGFRKALHSRQTNSLQIAELRKQYGDIRERLALAKIGAEEDDLAEKRLPLKDFKPLYRAIKTSEISFGDLLYAPLLRKTPDSRFETLHELLQLKRKLWPESRQ